MPERGRDEPLAVFPDRAAATAADDARLALEIAERSLTGRLMSLADLTSHPLVVGERVHDAHALGAREDEVEPRDRGEPLCLLPPLAALRVECADGDRPLADGRAQPRGARRVDAAKQGAEVAVLDHAGETEQLDAAAGPDSRRLAAARVVVVQTVRDLLLVEASWPNLSFATPSTLAPIRNRSAPRRRCTKVRIALPVS